MSKVLTNVYLEQEQRERIVATGKGIAETIREAIDFYLNSGFAEKGGETGRLSEEFREVKDELKAYKNLVHALLERIEKLEAQLPTK